MSLPGTLIFGASVELAWALYRRRLTSTNAGPASADSGRLGVRWSMSMRSKRTKRNPAEVKAWRATMGDIAKRVGKMDADAQRAITDRLGTVTCEGHPISVFNTCFLYMQAGDSAPLAMVGGFRQWKKADRSVRKGEKAIGYIYVPMHGAKDENKEEGMMNDDDLKGPRFRLVPVFDVTQTDPIEESAAA